MEPAIETPDTDIDKALDALLDDTARELLLEIDRYGKLRDKDVDVYRQRADDADEIIDTLEDSSLVVQQREITDTGSKQSYEITFAGERFLDLVKYDIADNQTADERYNGEIDDMVLKQLDVAAEQMNRMIMEYIEEQDDPVEFKELRLYSEERGVDQPYKELRKGLTEMEENNMAWTNDHFIPGQGNVVQCGLHPSGETIIQAFQTYRSNEAVKRPETGAEYL